MQHYKIQVRIKGSWHATSVCAENTTHARLIAEYVFGLGNVRVLGVLHI
jgi:hypothetical protein